MSRIQWLSDQTLDSKLANLIPTWEEKGASPSQRFVPAIIHSLGSHRCWGVPFWKVTPWKPKKNKRKLTWLAEKSTMNESKSMYFLYVQNGGGGIFLAGKRLSFHFQGTKKNTFQDRGWRGNLPSTLVLIMANSYLDVPGRKLGSIVRISGLFHLLIYGVYWGYNPLILTIY